MIQKFVPDADLEWKISLVFLVSLMKKKIPSPILEEYPDSQGNKSAETNAFFDNCSFKDSDGIQITKGMKINIKNCKFENVKIPIEVIKK